MKYSYFFIPLYLVVTIFVTASSSHALVVGTGGKTYPIAEKDMLHVIEKAVAKIDHEKLREDMQTKFKEQVKVFRLKDGVSALPQAERDMTYRVDLSFTVTPELAQGLVDVYGRSIYPAGTKVNPLALMRKQGITYPFKLIIINGDRPAELAWFTKQKLNDNPMVKVLITDGKPLELASQFKRPVYQLTHKIRERFQIKKTPSIVWWPEKSQYLAVKMFKVSEYTEDTKEGKEDGSNTAAHGSPRPLQTEGSALRTGTQEQAGTLEAGNRTEQQEKTIAGEGHTSTPPPLTSPTEDEELADTPIVEGQTVPEVESSPVLDRGGPDVAFPLAGQLF